MISIRFECVLSLVRSTQLIFSKSSALFLSLFCILNCIINAGNHHVNKQIEIIKIIYFNKFEINGSVRQVIIEEFTNEIILISIFKDRLMSSKKIILEQLATDSNLFNKHTVIIKRPFVMLPLASEQRSQSPQRRLKPLRSRSQNSHPRKNVLPKSVKNVAIQNSPRFTITSRHKIIKNEQKKNLETIKQDISTLKYHSYSILPQQNTKNKDNLKYYLQFIRAMAQQSYQISANFESFRKRNRRQPLKPSQKQLFQFILNIFISIYKNLQGKGKENSQSIFDSCQKYFRCFQKIKLQIILSIYYPNNLHTKLRPFIVYARLIMFSLSAFTIDNSIQKLSNSNKQSLKLVVQLLIEAYAGLFQPIKQQQTQVVSNIHQTFRFLKAIGEVEKKMQIIQKEMHKINTNRDIFIEQELKKFVNWKEQWNIQSLSQKEMKISWGYLKTPPVPYLPSKFTFKAYTLVIQLDHTMIYYDKQTKILKYRPFIDFFLHKASQNYQIIAFTKADHTYASILIGQIQRNTRYFNYILCKQHLSYSSDGRLIKDISRLGRELKNLVVVDYLPTIYKNYNMNGLAISSWYGDKSDKELERISILLQTIVINSVQDVRSFLLDLNEKAIIKDVNYDKQ